MKTRFDSECLLDHMSTAISAFGIVGDWALVNLKMGRTCSKFHHRTSFESPSASASVYTGKVFCLLSRRVNVFLGVRRPEGDASVSSCSGPHRSQGGACCPPSGHFSQTPEDGLFPSSTKLYPKFFLEFSLNLHTTGTLAWTGFAWNAILRHMKLIEAVKWRS